MRSPVDLFYFRVRISVVFSCYSLLFCLFVFYLSVFLTVFVFASQPRSSPPLAHCELAPSSSRAARSSNNRSRGECQALGQGRAGAGRRIDGQWIARRPQRGNRGTRRSARNQSQFAVTPLRSLARPHPPYPCTGSSSTRTLHCIATARARHVGVRTRVEHPRAAAASRRPRRCCRPGRAAG